MNGLLFVVLFGLFASALACTHDGKTYQNGDEWTVRNSFVMKCFVRGNGWETKVVACILPTSGARIPLNGSKTEGSYEWMCQMNGNGNIELKQGLNSRATCEGHAVGSRWQDRSFELECRPGGFKVLKACVAENGQRIAVNTSREVDGFTLICQQFANGTVLFHGAKSVKAPTNFNINTHNQKCIDEHSNERSIGSHWIENHRFNKTCKPGGFVEVVNCLTKEGYKIPLNGQVIRDNTKYSCELTDQGTIRFAAGPVSS
ncbi:hypothetical protein M3Y97_00090500 [Aphelenchoides bicaudatus]|nr:hypothetical protein M3Y97_00090500 [Aphelenchoides bicaudatus]